MHVETSRLARVRSLELTPEAFRRVAWIAVGAILLVMTTGAVVRLTASGLGCENWPRCGDTPFPAKEGHALIEFGNRVVGLIVILITLAAWIAARRTPRLPRRVTRLAGLVFLGTFAQIPLGGLTVIFELHPLLVMAHFLLALVVLGIAGVVGVEALRFERRGGEPRVPRELRLLGLVLAGACLTLVVTGAFATAAGPHSGGADIERLGSPTVAMPVHAAATGIFGTAFVFLLGYLAARRRQEPQLFRAGLGLLALLVAQVAVGEAQYNTNLPWPLVLVHVTLAASVWLGTVLLAAVLWRPVWRD